MSTISPTETMPKGLSIAAEVREPWQRILTPEALAFVAALHRQFNARRLELLAFRQDRQMRLDAGELPDFLPETKDIREGHWKVAPLPPDLLDRRVEITGPVDRKMMINALNSGARVFMADLEDSTTPNWENVVQGQLNLYDAVRRTISYEHPTTGKQYQLNEQTAVLMLRPRGWHLEDVHILIDGEPVSGSLLDFGLYFYHNAQVLIEMGSGPYFYLPKLESHLEARLWNDVFVFAQDYLGIPQKTIKATVLIETILASFELHEILWELRDHSAGLNCGRWDYIFSFIKCFRNRSGFVMPDRAQITMTVPFMKAYAHAVIQACHQRGVHAMGGMAAQIPIKNDPEANEVALEKVRDDKLREVRDGHDGSWVAHPGLVPVAMEIFDKYMPEKNQIAKQVDYHPTAAELIAVPEGTITEQGVRTNINVGILYLESWLRGNGAAALYHLMEDAATAEISRTQLWQWQQSGATLDDGRRFTIELYRSLREEEVDRIARLVGMEHFRDGRFDEAIALFDRLVLSDQFEAFLTLPAYKLVS